MSTATRTIDEALRLAELEYAVFPCAPGTKVPATENGFYDATTDPSRIEEWWRKTPSANLALYTRGLLVVDIDTNGTPNPWPPTRAHAADLERVPRTRSPRGGSHHYFRQPSGRDWRCTESKIANHVDTRANGGYVVLPPSFAEGDWYRWVEPLSLRIEDLSEPPGWLAELVDAHSQSTTPTTESRARSALAPKDASLIPSGQRNATLASLAGTMRRVGMARNEILAALLETNRTRCLPPLADREVEQIAVSICRYEPDRIAVAMAEHHWAQDRTAADDASSSPTDPGALSDDFYRIPGFVSEVMDHTLRTAPYPNVVMAFTGALALLALLAGRKVRDPGNNRTNLYILGLAHSGAGKDRPRQVNAEILHEIGAAHRLAGTFSSGEGIQDALNAEPSLLFQTDEIDGMLQSINKGRDARWEAIMNTLLTFYSSASSVFPMRKKAGKEAAGAINQPCLVLFGTAIPRHYYAALSERMLTNGFFARMLILECGPRGTGQEPSIEPIPESVLRTARWWAEYRPSGGNLVSENPEPRIVPQTEEARDLLSATRRLTEVEYSAAEARGDEVGTTVWGRVSEHARKLALLYAVSACHETPQIGADAAHWATALAVHQARRMLFQASANVAENPFHAECLKLIAKLDSVGGEMSHSRLLKAMRTDSKTFAVLVQTLAESGQLVVRKDVTATRPGTYYAIPEADAGKIGGKNLENGKDSAIGTSPRGEGLGKIGKDSER
ncbi:MAG: bifunctional DNA primase/polymerase [Candidatus Eisenbacteria bacterium]